MIKIFQLLICSSISDQFETFILHVGRVHDFRAGHNFVSLAIKLVETKIHITFQSLLETRSLPSATLGKEQMAKPHPAKGSLPSAVCRALGKGFAECQDGTRQRRLAVSR